MPAFGQEVVAAGNPDADKLAGNVRRLAADPRDTLALLDAGDLSARLGDTSAAMSFFARAEAIDPTNPRILSGRAATLVRLERPGEALRLFQAAEARGLRVTQFASDRGWAYDLLGAPDLAQRDYRTALAQFRDDETVRRYALSLGITGDVAQAMKELDPLLRRSDRAAWRARAFIMAMNGDIAGADRIATTMMPGNMGAGLAPFFRRLAGMGPSDRAFAVHFGELTPTQARLADARMVPDLPRWSPQPRPVEVAAAPPPPPQPVAQPQGRDRRGRRDRSAVAPPVQLLPAPVVAAAEPDLPPPPQYVEPVEIVQPTPMPTPTPAPVPVPVQLASRTMVAPERFTIERPTAPMSDAQPETLGGKAPVRTAALSPKPAPAKPKPEAAKPKPEAAKPKPEAAKPKAEPAAKTPAKTDPKAKTPAKPDPKAKTPAKTDPKAKKPDPAKGEPARVWVQVAGGANEDTLSKAWKAVVAKAPAAMKGRSAWTAPLRATNRVLAGPFKTTAEAQSFVNTLGKAGVSAFVFSSEAGQKITKLVIK